MILLYTCSDIINIIYKYMCLCSITILYIYIIMLFSFYVFFIYFLYICINVFFPQHKVVGILNCARKHDRRHCWISSSGETAVVIVVVIVVGPLAHQNIYKKVIYNIGTEILNFT